MLNYRCVNYTKKYAISYCVKRKNICKGDRCKEADLITWRKKLNNVTIQEEK